MTEEQRAQESKQRGAAAAKIKDPAARRAYIAQQGNSEAFRRSFEQHPEVLRAMRSAEASGPLERAFSRVPSAARRISQGRRGRSR